MTSLCRSSLLLCCLLVALCVRARTGACPLTVGTNDLGLALDQGRGCALASVWVGGVEFRNGGEFPCLTLFDEAGREEHSQASDARWRTELMRLKHAVRMRYSCEGFRADGITARRVDGEYELTCPKGWDGLS